MRPLLSRTAAPPLSQLSVRAALLEAGAATARSGDRFRSGPARRFARVIRGDSLNCCGFTLTQPSLRDLIAFRADCPMLKHWALLKESLRDSRGYAPLAASGLLRSGLEMLKSHAQIGRASCRERV